MHEYGYADLDPVRRELALLRELDRRQKRETYEASLAEFTKAAWHILEPGTELVWNWHLDVLCAYIQAFFDGKIRRLIINVPPGSMKSILFSVMGPCHKWALDPTARMINITNEIGLASRDNRRMRDIVVSDWYKEYWINTTHTIDYKVKSVEEVEEEKKTTRITLQRVGIMPMPIDLVVTLNNGKTHHYNIPLRIMRGEKKEDPQGGKLEYLPDWAWTHPTYEIDLPIKTKKIAKVEIDPSQRMMDVERGNNVLELK